MIYFGFGISNPFHNTAKRKPQIDYIEFDEPWTVNKNVSFQLSKSEEPHDLFDFTFRWDLRGQDHAGLYISVTLWKYWTVFNIYDKRHWNDDENRWYHYDEEWD